MGAFRYRLARVLRVRELEECEALGAWSEAESVAQGIARESGRLAAELRTEQGHLATRLESGPFEPACVLSTYQALDGMEKHLGIQRGLLAEARRHTDELQEAWRERKAAVESLERLRDRARRRFAQLEARDEAAALDEQASVRAARGAADAADTIDSRMGAADADPRSSFPRPLRQQPGGRRPTWRT